MALKGLWRDPEVDLKHTIQLNSVLDKVGYFGWFHVLQLSLMVLTSFLGIGPAFSSYAYTGYMPKYRLEKMYGD